MVGSTTERAGGQQAGEQAAEFETLPWALRKFVRGAGQQATDLGKVRCANCRNLTGGLALRIMGDGLVTCIRCASHVETLVGPGGIVELVGE